jgi:hypothetical protein
MVGVEVIDPAANQAMNTNRPTSPIAQIGARVRPAGGSIPHLDALNAALHGFDMTLYGERLNNPNRKYTMKRSIQ